MSEINYNEKYKDYIGIDEVARGNAFGPSLFVGVRLKVPYKELDFVVDSKTTNKSQRTNMVEKIKKSVDYHLVEIPPSDIDNKGLSICIKGALENIKEHFGKGNKYLYDGNKTFGATNIETLVKADNKVISVSCASIIAKAALDTLMEGFHKQYPEYNLIKNSGYITKQHVQAIKEYGYTPLHRKSYKIKELEEDKNKKTTDILF